jgi:hypothetical protein
VEVLAALPGRNWKGIGIQAAKLEVRRKRVLAAGWTKTQDRAVRNYYPSKGAQHVAELTGRTVFAVRMRAITLGVRSEVVTGGRARPRPNTLDYTLKERALLAKHYPTTTREQMEEMLPGRKWPSIQALATRLKIRRQLPQSRPSTWTEAELAILRAEYPKQGVMKVAALLGCTSDRVNLCAKKLGLQRPQRYVPKPMPAKVAKAPKAPKEPKEARLTKADRELLKKVAAPTPVKRSPITPTLNTRAEQRRLAEKLQEQKPKPFVTAAEIRELRADHPARWAYTVAARQGPEAATAAFRQAMSQLNQAA